MAIKTYYNIKQLLTLEGAKKKDGRKINQEDLGLIENAWVAVENGKIKDIGTGKAPSSDHNIDLNSAVVMPCFIDSHTHVTYAGTRVNE